MASDELTFGKLLKVFLCRPDKEQFNTFFELCYLRCRNNLRILRAKGWLLPLDARTDKDPIDDLVFDVLGPLFASRRGKSFYLIFEHFEKLETGNFQNLDSELLTSHFMVLLWSFTRQEMQRIRGENDPAKARIKRRFQDILKGSEYCSLSNKHKTTEFVGHKDYRLNMRSDSKIVTRELMVQIATQSLLSTIKDTDLCRDFFRRLNEMDEYQNTVPFKELISIFVAVRISYAEEGMILPFQPISPEIDLAKKELGEAIERALSQVWIKDIKILISNGRLSEDQGRSMLEACCNYLQDSCNGNGTDSFPHYFREFLPTHASEYYSSKFKYPFETAMNKAMAYFREDIEDNLLKGTFGDY